LNGPDIKWLVPSYKRIISGQVFERPFLSGLVWEWLKQMADHLKTEPVLPISSFLMVTKKDHQFKINFVHAI
jgi:hypothetical protein